MFCPRCDSPVPDGANFCMRCGNPMAVKGDKVELKQQPAAALNPAAVPGPMPAPVRNSNALPYLVMALIVVIVFIVGWGASQLLQARAAPIQTLQVARKPEKILQTAAPVPQEMPPSVHDWLEHLRRTEEQKNKLTAEQVAKLKMFAAKFEALGPAAGMLGNGGGEDDDMTNPAQPVNEDITDMVGPWNTLIKNFQAVPPPPECQQLADEYFAGLNEIPAEMNDLQKVLQHMTQSMSGEDPSSGETDANKEALKSAQMMQGKSKQDIDTHFNNSDELLSDVCDKYHTRKWFSITPDLGGGLLGTPF